MADEKKVNICEHWWNNYQFVYNDWSLFSALIDPSLGLSYDESTQIQESLDPLNDSDSNSDSDEDSDEDSESQGLQFTDWETYYQNMDASIVAKFEKWYKDLEVVGDKMLCSYEWRLPTKYTKTAIALLVYGYYRESARDQSIIADISDLLRAYFGEISYLGQRDTFKEWKTVDYRSGVPPIYRSGVFTYGSFRFCLVLQNVGGSDIDIDSLKYRILIEWICAPEEMFNECVVQFSCFYVEKRYKSYGEFRFLLRNKSAEPQKIIFAQIMHSDIEAMIECGTATFKLYFHQFTLDKNPINIGNGKAIVLNESIHGENTQMYEWERSSATENECGPFPIHGCQCQIQLSQSSRSCARSGFTVNFEFPPTVEYMYFSYDVSFNGTLLNPRSPIMYGCHTFEADQSVPTQNLGQNGKDIFVFYFHLIDMIEPIEYPQKQSCCDCSFL